MEASESRQLSETVICLGGVFEVGSARIRRD